MDELLKLDLKELNKRKELQVLTVPFQLLKEIIGKNEVEMEKYLIELLN